TRSFPRSPSGGAQAGQNRHLSNEELDHLGVPLASGAAAQDRERLLLRFPLAIWAVVDQGVVGIAHGHNAREARDARAGETVGIAGAVVVLVVMADDRQKAGARAQWRDDVLADDRVQVHG